jgi:hypothetical protein
MTQTTTESVAARQVRLGRTMGIAGLCALVPLLGNAIATLLTGWASRASWLIVPAVGVGVAMVKAGIEAYGSPPGRQHPAKDTGQDLQGPTDRRRVRGETSLAFALIVAVLLLGFGGLAVSEGTRYVVLKARTTIRDSKPAPGERSRQEATPAPSAAAPPPAPAPVPKPAPPAAAAPPPAPARFAHVPAVAGLSSLDAAYKLQDRGFKPRGAFEPSSTVPFNHVTRTDPPAGTKLRRGKPVTLYVSSSRPGQP